MASFKLINDYRTNLYHGKYRFKTSFYINNLGLTRNVKDISEVHSKLNWLISRRSLSKDILKKIDFSLLETFIQWRKSIDPEKVSIRSDMNKLTVYSNDLNYLMTLPSILGIPPLSYQEAIVESSKNIMFFVRTPPTKFRIYLKPGKSPSDFKKNTIEFIDRYKNTDNELKPSKALLHWLRHGNHHWIGSSKYIGYNHESTYMLLALMMPEVISKNYKLEKRKDQ